MDKNFGPSLLPGTPKEHPGRPSPGGPEGERPQTGAAAVIPPPRLSLRVIPLPQPAGLPCVGVKTALRPFPPKTWPGCGETLQALWGICASLVPRQALRSWKETTAELRQEAKAARLAGHHHRRVLLSKVTSSKGRPVPETLAFQQW